MDRSKFAKLFLLIAILPFAVYILGSCIVSYIPPTESYKKTPKQFEELFNDKMAQYGMSIDVDSANSSYGENVSKTIPILCEDGSKITCTYYTNSARHKALIQYIIYKQELSDAEEETVYIEPILRFMLDEFDTALTEDKDKSFNPYAGTSYNEALRICKDFVNGNEAETEFLIFPKEDYGAAVTLERETDEISYLSISLLLWSN